MEEIRKCIKYWLLPLENLQAGTRYHDSIPGDSPELMPLDETLNQDIHSTARYHVAITSHLPKDDPRKFSFSTPKEISRAYLRLVDRHTGGAPSSRRIIQDCEKWVRSMLYFSDLETEENVSRKRNNIMMHSDDEDMDIGQEENDYELLDEEVMSVLLGLTENMALE
jgi:hypothetical protein